MAEFYRRIRENSFPLALLILCLISFIPTIYRLGFYWDDWPSIWFYHMWGPSSFREGFAIDRPLLAYVFMLTTPIMGESALSWQLFGVFTRWLTSLALWWTFCGIWPKHKRQASWAVILFTIYPGFSQQYISVTYSNAFLVRHPVHVFRGRKDKAQFIGQRRRANYYPGDSAGIDDTGADTGAVYLLRRFTEKGIPC